MKTLPQRIALGRSSVVALAVAAFMLPGGAYAQSMSPMRGKVTSFTDSFAVRVFPSNPYRHRIKVEVRVYDANFRPVRALISPNTMMLAGNSSRQVTVMVPFGADRERRVRVCTESVPFARDGSSNIRTQICGKFIGQRR